MSEKKKPGRKATGKKVRVRSYTVKNIHIEQLREIQQKPGGRSISRQIIKAVVDFINAGELLDNSKLVSIRTTESDRDHEIISAAAEKFGVKKSALVRASLDRLFRIHR